VLVRALLLVALDVPAQEVEPVVDVGDQSLLLRQAQAHRCQDPDEFVAHPYGILAGAADEDEEVVGVPHQAVVGDSVTSPSGSLRLGLAVAALAVSEVLI
jgi:hypothetical protein